MTAESFWRPNEHVIESYKGLVTVIDEVFTKWASRRKVFAWRGQVDASWPLYSSLYRRLAWHQQHAAPEENDLHEAEGTILADVHRWGLHAPNGMGRLSVLGQLATLQHYGAPTRLIDVTFNPWIAAWFAVEEKWNNGERVHVDADARLFAVDVTDRLINEQPAYRKWEDSLARPWPRPLVTPVTSAKRKKYQRWCTTVLAWRPARLDARIAAQDGGFLFGGVPVSQGPTGPEQWSKGTTGSFWKIAEVRKATSLALHPHKLRTVHGGVAKNAVYSFRILAAAKGEIRQRLERNFDYTHRTIYPDFTGFALFGTPKLRSRP